MINRTSSQEFEGPIKWFDAARGYGFVQPKNFDFDVLIHASVLKACGYGKIPHTGVWLRILAEKSYRGWRTTKVLSMEWDDN